MTFGDLARHSQALFLWPGDVLTFDATCKDGLDNLRLTQIDTNSWVGNYLYVSKSQPRLQLEPAVRMHRDGDCR